MSRKTKTIAILLLVVAVMIMIALVALFGSGHRGPLTEVEKALVGSWSRVSLSEHQSTGEIIFRSDRTFRTREGDLTGRWWISLGQLHLKVWRDGEKILPFANALIVPFADAWHAARADTDSWQPLDKSGDRFELFRPGEPRTILKRVR